MICGTMEARDAKSETRGAEQGWESRSAGIGVVCTGRGQEMEEDMVE